MNVCAAEVPPPGAGVLTATDAMPLDAISLAPIDACSWLPLTTVVGRSPPFHRTMDAALKALPFTVSVKAPLPANARAGAIDVKSAAG